MGDLKIEVVMENDIVTVTMMNHIVEVQYMEKMNRNCYIKKLDKDHYIDLRTGEKKEFEHLNTRKDSYNSLRQTFKKLRYLINNNFVGNGNELHIILTYAENMTDSKRLYTDFNKFIKKLKRRFNGKSTIDYISVVEPQERGAWHIHLLIRFNDLDKVYIENSKVADLWGQGFVMIKSLRNVDNIGAYLSAYLSDIELNEKNIFRVLECNNEIVEREVDGQKKKFIKGGRLHMYPPGMNIFRKSSGIKYPERKMMKYKEAKKMVGGRDPHYQKSIFIENEEFQNIITYEQYNMLRK